MPKVSATDAIKLRRYVSEFPEFEVCGENELYCPLCICTVNYRKRDFVTAHRNTKKHATVIRNKESKQPTLQGSTSKGNFFDKVTYAFLSADIPLEKLNNIQLRELFDLMKHPLPSESAARSRVQKLADLELCKIKTAIEGKDVFIMIDESEIRDQKLMNVLCGSTDSPERVFLVCCKPLLTPADTNSVCQCVDDVMRQLDCPKERFILMQSDAARYMTSAAGMLQIIYPKMHHVTCAAHLIHNCALRIRSHYTAVDNLISKVKASVVKNKTRRALYAGIGTPPTVVVTRWSSWLRGALYYSKNLPKVKEIVENYKGEGIIVANAKESVRDLQLATNLLAIKRDYGDLVDLIDKMQSSSYSISQCWSDLQKLMKDGLGMDECQIKPYLSRRLLKTGMTEIMNMARDDISPDQFVLLQNCQATTSDVERSFSMLKKILASDRQFSSENVAKYLILYFNSAK